MSSPRWENDGYSTSSNYYFVSAFAAFYDYYKEYEENCIKNANNNQKKKKEIEEKYLAALREKGKAVDLDVREFEEQNEKIAALEAEITGLKENIAAYENDPLRSALTGFVKTILSQAIVDVLADELSREAGRILSTTKDRVLQKAEEYKADNGTDTVPLDGWPRTKKEGFEKGMSDLLLALMMVAEQKTLRQSFLVRFRDKLIPLGQEDIAYCYTSEEKVFAYGYNGERYPMEYTLEALQGMLSPTKFYRANRQFIIARDAVADISVWFGSRLSVNLKMETPEKIIVSKARVPEFKQWLVS